MGKYRPITTVWLVNAFDEYYPSGDNTVRAFNSKESAEEYIRKCTDSKGKVNIKNPYGYSYDRYLLIQKEVS